MPGIIGDPRLLVNGAGQHEKEIAKPVEIFNRIGGRGGLEPTRKGHHPSFSATADSPGHVQRRRQRSTRRQDEISQWFKGCVIVVDRRLERLHLAEGDPLIMVTRSRQLCTEVEEIALNLSQQPIKHASCRIGPGHAQQAVELIDCAEGFDPGVVLGDPRPTEQPCLACVTSLRIDLHLCYLKALRFHDCGATNAAPILGRFEESFNLSSVRHVTVSIIHPASRASGGLMACLLAAVISPPAVPGSELEQRFFSTPVQVTDGLTKAGEGYFSPDMTRICYQGVPSDYPFYQIYIQPFDATAPRIVEPTRVSTGRGRTTCAWFAPDGRRLLFASSHLDPQLSETETTAIKQAEEDARTGRRRRYQWDFDPHMDLFVADLERPGPLSQLTKTPGYDAECSFSPDGSQLLFVSDRDGDPDIYVAEADGRNVRQLTDQPGYDGGPFFSPDGHWIAYRTDRLAEHQLQIHVMRADGSGDAPITAGAGVHWAPYWHPTRPWLIWTGADHSDPTKRPNYDLWLVRYETDANGFHTSEPLRLTDHPGADVLPVFSPDGSLLMWTASRDGEGGRRPSSQLYVSRLNLEMIDAALAAKESRQPRPEEGQ